MQRVTLDFLGLGEKFCLESRYLKPGCSEDCALSCYIMEMGKQMVSYLLYLLLVLWVLFSRHFDGVFVEQYWEYYSTEGGEGILGLLISTAGKIWLGSSAGLARTLEPQDGRCSEQASRGSTAHVPELSSWCEKTVDLNC